MKQNLISVSPRVPHWDIREMQDQHFNMPNVPTHFQNINSLSHRGSNLRLHSRYSDHIRRTEQLNRDGLVHTVRKSVLEYDPMYQNRSEAFLTPRVSRHPSALSTVSNSESRLSGNFDDQCPAAFKALVSFYQLIGLSFFSFNDNILIRVFTVLTSIIFAAAFVSIHVPCLFTCHTDVDLTNVFKNGVSAKFIEVAVLFLELYHVISCHLEFILKGGRLRRFFPKCEMIIRCCKTSLSETSLENYMRFVFMVIALNLVHAAIEGSMLVFLTDHRLSDKGWDENNSTKVYININEKVVYWSSFTIQVCTTFIIVNSQNFISMNLSQFLGSIHSKAPESLATCLTFYVAIVIKKYNERIRQFIQNYDIAEKPNLELERLLLLELRAVCKDLEALLDSL